jgi:hypothetical protein
MTRAPSIDRRRKGTLIVFLGRAGRACAGQPYMSRFRCVLRTPSCATAPSLGGEVSGLQVRCPGPGHSATERSLSVRQALNDDGFVVHSFSMAGMQGLRSQEAWSGRFQAERERQRRIDPAPYDANHSWTLQARSKLKMRYCGNLPRPTKSGSRRVGLRSAARLEPTSTARLAGAWPAMRWH